VCERKGGRRGGMSELPGISDSDSGGTVARRFSSVSTRCRSPDAGRLSEIRKGEIRGYRNSVNTSVDCLLRGYACSVEKSASLSNREKIRVERFDTNFGVKPLARTHVTAIPRAITLAFSFLLLAPGMYKDQLSIPAASYESNLPITSYL
jgi:hypothetical protein